MTGYGKAEVLLPDKKVTIEIKSLNGKNSDTNVKSPMIYREKEIWIRKILQDTLKRGKIDCFISYEMNEGSTSSSINPIVFKAYFHQIEALKKELKLSDENIISTILRLPDTVKAEKIDLDEKEWQKVEEGIFRALNELQQFRKQEGEVLAEEMKTRVQNILDLLASVDKFEKDRIEKLKYRIIKSLEELKLSETLDSNRLEQEMIYYLEKLDVSEEKSRLENHCRYFLESMEEDEEAGKKLSFISQEMGREINTLGSKANDSDIQRIVVQMKDELEKIKEQSLNIL
jgi:uncharacterized protein (TIGR00255 family)